MKTCCFIIPYFGNFPNYFPLFLKTCSWNKDFNWLLITDNNEQYEYPDNVEVIKMSFTELKALIQKKFEFNIKLSKPYKLCDFRPAYGYIFEKYIKDFRWWGYCDIDTIMGDLSHFLTDELFDKYDKIFCLGHMTIFKNNKENDQLFLSRYKGQPLYKKIFSDNKNYGFDEEWRDDNNINQIFLAEGKKVFLKDYSMNPSISYNSFVRTQYVGHTTFADSHGYKTEKPKKALYVWDNGHVYRYFKEDSKLIREEFIYMHFQMRKFKVSNKILNANRFKIIPNKFLPLEVDEINERNFRNIKTNGLCFHVQRLMWNRLKKKFIKLISHA